MREKIIRPLNDEYKEYLRDESRIWGEADSISFPKTEKDLRVILTALKDDKQKITIQGSRTGITGGAIPTGGHILNLSKMNKIKKIRYDAGTGNYFLTVQPGVLLLKLKQILSTKEFT